MRLIFHYNHNNFVDTHVLKKPGKGHLCFENVIVSKEYIISEDHVYSSNNFCKFFLRFILNQIKTNQFLIKVNVFLYLLNTIFTDKAFKI